VAPSRCIQWQHSIARGASIGFFGEDDRAFLRIDHTLLVLSYLCLFCLISGGPGLIRGSGDGCSRWVIERERRSWIGTPLRPYAPRDVELGRKDSNL
jgi:hypothetical protein